MAYSLKSTGLGADCICCVVTDDDNSTVVDLGANGGSMTYDAALPSPASGSWKSTTRYYWAVREDGFGFDGLTWSSGNRYSLEAGTGGSGYAVFMACHGDSAGNIGGGAIMQGTLTSGLAILRRDGGSGEPSIHLGTAATELLAGSTAWSTTAKFSAGWQYKRSGAAGDEAIWYGLEASAGSSISFDASDTPGADGQTDDMVGFGGWAGQYGDDIDIYCLAIFNRPLALSEWRNLHDDWFGELVDASSTVVIPSSHHLRYNSGSGL